MADLKELSDMVKYMLHLEVELTAAEDHVKQLTRDLQRFSREHIPDLMADLAIQELKMDTGEQILIGQKYYANISEARSEAAFKWLRKNGQGSIIKTAISGVFGAGDEDTLDKLVLENFLKEKQIVYDRKEAVNPQTLKSFVKTQMEDPAKVTKFPTALFGVHVVTETVVKAKKQ